MLAAPRHTALKESTGRTILRRYRGAACRVERRTAVSGRAPPHRVRRPPPTVLLAPGGSLATRPMRRLEGDTQRMSDYRSGTSGCEGTRASSDAATPRRSRARAGYCGGGAPAERRLVLSCGPAVSLAALCGAPTPLTRAIRRPRWRDPSSVTRMASPQFRRGGWLWTATSALR